MDYRWDDLRVFLALYRQRTLAAAGAKVGLDGSTVSRRLGALEAALGASLFDRTRDGVVPTSAAEQLLPAAEEAERGAIAVLHLAEGLETEAKGLVRITAPPLVVEAFLAPALPQLRASHPGVRLELIGSTAYADLTRREADIAMRVRRATAGDLVSVRAAIATQSVYASPGFAADRGLVAAWTDVPWATWSEELADRPASRWLLKHAPAVVPAVTSTSLGALLAAAQCGYAAVIANDVVARRFGLVPLRITATLEADVATLPVEETWLIGHQALRSVPRIAVVWDFLRRELAKLSAEVPPAEVS